MRLLRRENEAPSHFAIGAIHEIMNVAFRLDAVVEHTDPKLGKPGRQDDLGIGKVARAGSGL